MNQAELRELAAQLDRAGPEDYKRAAALVADLADRLPAMDEEDRARVDLNADLPQLAFHLREELERGDPESLAGSLEFMRRHLVRIEAEWVDRAHLELDPLDRELVTGLARLTRQTYEDCWAPVYRDAGYRRPWVDKLYRDYALTGVPDGLIAQLAAIAADGSCDAILSVLKGGLPYTLLIELLGTSTPVLHVMCGRASGSHVAPDYMVRPLDFEWDELTGKRVLVVDNNAATGATLAHLANELARVDGLRADLFLDYVVTAFTQLGPQTFTAMGYESVLIGPYTAGTHEMERKRHVVRAVAQRLPPPEGLA